jgi:hypothetical protein
VKNQFTKLEIPSNRKFGFFFTTIFIIIGFYLFYNNQLLESYFLFSFALVLFSVSIIRENLLLPLNILWMKIGFFLGKVINPIILGIIYFLIFTPTSLIMKLFKRDELKLKLKETKSYWKIRNMNKSQSIKFEKQF